MGWKTAILMACDHHLARGGYGLPARGTPDPAATADLVARAYPRWTATPAEDSSLLEATYPRPGIAYAGSFPSAGRFSPAGSSSSAGRSLSAGRSWSADRFPSAGRVRSADIICDREFMLDHPSRLPPHLVALGAGRRLVLHTMHSVVDFFAFGVWEDGTLVRSLSMALGGPRPGIMENIGTPLPFEQPYWAGEHAIGEEYPLPFYPLDLAEPTATRALLGFALSEPPDHGMLDAGGVRLGGFTVPAANPAANLATGRMAAARTRKRYRLVNGALVEIDE